MAQGNQMHMLTESAEHAQVVVGSTAQSFNGHVTRLTGEVNGVVGSAWSMDQANAFMTAHSNWAEAMGKLVVALEKVGADTGAAVNDYFNNDLLQASAIGKVQTPMFSNVL